MRAYIILSVLIGIRTEEARALLWVNVHLDGETPHVDIWRSVRERGETKSSEMTRHGMRWYDVDRVAHEVAFSV